MRFETLAIHAGQGPDRAFGAVSYPIYQTSTFAFKAVNQPGPFDYSRSGNPTRKALEDCLAALENGNRGFAFATGQAAEATFLSLLKSGDHILVHEDLYGGTYRLLTQVVSRYGIDVQFVNMCDLSAVARAIRPQTKAMWIETPTNPLMTVLDLKGLAAVAGEHGVVTICDNTFLSPYFQKPLDLGIDVVMHSTTKYINGHSDVVGGALITKRSDLAEKIAFHQNTSGAVAGPQDCFLVMRGVKTLAVRMEAHNRNALTIANWLQGHDKVKEVLHPGLASHPQYDLAKEQMTGYGGTFSFRLKGGLDAVTHVLSHCRIFTLAESLGGVESLIEHPWCMTHASMPEDVRRKVGITEDLIRVSVGIEHIDDLIEDLDRALKGIK